MKSVSLDEFIENAQRANPLADATYKAIYQRRLSFLEEHWSVPPGKPFSTEGRDWLVDQFRAFEGFKAWPVDREHICASCLDLVNEVIDHPLEVTSTRTQEHAERTGGCRGLDAKAIYYHLFDAARRGGKTSTMFAHAASVLYQDHGARMRFSASGFDHTLSLGSKNYYERIRANSTLLQPYIHIQESKGVITNKRRRNFLELGSASEAASLGGGYEHLYFDECKKINFKIIAALMPTMNENYGLRCTKCKHKTHGGSRDYTHPDFDWQCPLCGSLLVPWNARMYMASNAKVLEGDPERDWYPMLCDALLASPFAHAHMLKFDDPTKMNPDYNEDARSAHVDLINLLPGLEHYADAELGNESSLAGSTVFSDVDKQALFRRKLENTAVKEPCFFYLDMARRVDKVCLFGWTDRSAVKDWGHLENVHLSMWHPGKDRTIASPVGDGSLALDEDKLANILCEILSKYPGMIGCWIDVRGHKWAAKFYEKMRALRKVSFAHKFQPYEAQGIDRDLGWTMFYDRSIARLVDLIYHERYETEFAQASWQRQGRRLVVRERAKGHGAQARDKYHLELTDGVAASHFIATIIDELPMTLTEHQALVESAIKRKRGGTNAKFGNDLRSRLERLQGKLSPDKF